MKVSKKILFIVFYGIFKPTLVKSQQLPGVNAFPQAGIYRNRGLFPKQCLPFTENSCCNNINQPNFLTDRTFVVHPLWGSRRPSPYDRHIQEGNMHLKDRQIEQKYGHAKDFGVEGSKDRKNLETFKDKIVEHLREPTTERLKGTYRKQQVEHFFNPETNLSIMINATTREFISGWRLSDPQVQRVDLKARELHLGGAPKKR